MAEVPGHDRTTSGEPPPGPAESASGAGATRARHVQSPGDLIGPYRLLEMLGEGGFGEVWLAEQKAPIARRVALKIIKPGMDSRAVIARFEQERQALALMNHPNIARVFDAGTTDSGRPYFAMEHVKGAPITEHCDRERLTIDDRLRLFHRVCEAVHHAHMKGVIHRDLKPSNILVTSAEGGEARPVVIDFGVAKAVASRLTDKTIHTERGQLIGTPEYMSPEQAEMAESDIDTRTDVYALGVILYELLTGELPFDSQALREAGYAEIQRIIREVDPPKPSTKLSALRGTDLAPEVRAQEPRAPGSTDPRGRVGATMLDTIAAQRRTDPATLTRELRRELDWIPLKALRKERAHRYRSAAELGDDIGNYLGHRPLIAGPESGAYRLKKFVRRHRVGVVAGMLVASSIVLGLGAAVWQAGVAARQRDAARAAAEDARRAEALAEQRREDTERVAEFQAAQLRGIDPEVMGRRLRELVIADAAAGLVREGAAPEEVTASTARLRDLLSRANPTNVALRTLDENIFDTALSAVHERFAAQPLVRARLLQTLSDTMRGLGLPDRALAPQTEALAIRRAALGDDHPDTIESINGMGVALEAQGKPAEGEVYIREALERSRRVLGPDAPITITTLSNIGAMLRVRGRFEEAEPMAREVLESCRRVMGPGHAETLSALNNMGVLMHSWGKLAEAEPFIRESAELHRNTLGNEHVDTLVAVGNLGALLDDQGRYDEAEPLYREVLAARRRILGDDHRQTLDSVRRMGRASKQLGKFADADMYYTEAVERGRRVMGGDHPETLDAISSLGSVYQAQGRLAEAEQLLLESLECRRRVLGPDHPDTLDSLNSVGVLIRARGRFAEAEPSLRECAEKSRLTLGPDHHTTLTRLSNLGVLLRDLNRFDQAEAIFREVLERRRRVLGPAHPETIAAFANLGAVLESQDRLTEAEPYLREAADTSRRVLGEDHPDTLSTLSNLGAVLRAMGRLEEADPLLRAALDGRRRVLGEDHPSTLISLANFGGLMRASGRLDEAEECFREVLERRRRVLGEDHPGTIMSLNNLGVLLQQRGDLDGAEECFSEVLGRRLAAQAAGSDGPPAAIARLNLGRVLVARERFTEAEEMLLGAERVLAPAGGAGTHGECVAALIALYESWDRTEPGKGMAAKAAGWKTRANAPKP